MEQSLSTKGVEAVTGNITEEYAVIGGGARSKLWCQIIADTSGKRVITMTSDEASSLGAGISAAVASGWYPTFAEAAKNMVHEKSVIHPDQQNAELYRNQLIKFQEIYPAISQIGKSGNTDIL